MSTHVTDDLLAAAVDGTLSEDDRAVVEAHLPTCARCRDELASAAAAREALDALSEELTPPIDVAAAVGAAIASRTAATGGHTAAAPRWYRAAGLVAAAAAIALAVMVIPDLTQREGSPEATDALGAAPQEAGGSSAGEDPVTFADAPALEVVSTDFDHASLAALVEETRRTAGVGAPGAATTTPAAQASENEALACLRAGAGHAISADAHVQRLLAATFERTPAYIGAVVTGPADDPTQIVAVAVATADCRLLDSA
jgi:hypothetical protein